MKKVATAIAAIVAATTLMGGVAAAAPSIDTTGPLSVNVIKEKNKSKCEVLNFNEVVASNSTEQKAKSGKAKVVLNTTGGSATSGDATNDNATTVDATVTNNGSDTCAPCGCEAAPLQGLGEASISTTGPLSVNVIKQVNKQKVTVVNTNTVVVSNGTSQTAKSGKAVVALNTNGGSAVSGAALNTNSTNFTLVVSNN